MRDVLLRGDRGAPRRPSRYVVGYLGDLDRSGRDAARSLQEKLNRFGADCGVAVEFRHLAIDEEDILDYDVEKGLLLAGIGDVTRWLPTRPPKRNTPADRAWPYPFACELDAIEPDDLRALVRWAIEHYLPADQLRLLQIAEASERELIKGLVAGLAGEAEEEPRTE